MGVRLHTFTYVVLVPDAGADVGYFSYLFKSVGYIGALQATANFIRDGQDLNFGNFSRVPLPLVPMSEQIKIAALLGRTLPELDAGVSRAQRQIALMRELRTRFVADVVTGKIDVRGVPVEAVEEDVAAVVEGAESGDVEEEEALNAN